MKSFRDLFILFFLLVLAGVESAEACKCSGRPRGENVQTCGYFWSAETVFIGRADAVTIEGERMKVTFSVEKHIRGAEAGEKSVEIFTSPDTATCGYPFKEGERYFVYGRKGSDGKYGEGLCGATVPLADAADDLAYLGEIEAGKTGTRIYGYVSEDRQATPQDKRSLEPVAGIEVTLRSLNNKNKFKTVTDERGFFIFKEIPPGGYRVAPEFPDGLREIFVREDLTGHEAGVNLGAGRCDMERFIVTRQGSIEGKIAGYDNRKAPQLNLSLLALDENDNPPPEFTPFKSIWADKVSNRFYFNAVPSGKYLLVVNPGNCPLQPSHTQLRELDLEFGRMFYNGAANSSEARIVTVGAAQQVKLGDFMILPPLKERWFSGVVRTADKKPLAGATVILRDSGSSRCGLQQNVKTDADGRFRLKGFETYRYEIRAYSEIDPQKTNRLFSQPLALAAEGSVENIELIPDSPY